VIVIYFVEKKRETKFLLAVILFIYDNSTVQNRFFGGIRTWLFCFLKGNNVLNRTSCLWPLAPPYRGQIPMFSRVFRQF
jgi:hypothetical protein